ncbi:MAG TPA: HD domain-containing protein [Lachnospiraceae bacterium]|nr:HD domain-containing protein [Lachnospiraceae bacterium]
MQVDRTHVIETFQTYTKHYDITDEKIHLKVVHTYRVASLSEQIARNIQLSESDIELAWLIGMLHDIGRFEQLRRYDTFMDAESVDHAALGVEILFQDGEINHYVTDHTEDSMIRTAIANHNLFCLPDNLTEREQTFCQIVRDADKIDILRVNVDFKIHELYNTTADEFYSCKVTEKVMESFMEEHATLRSVKKTPIDHIAGHISLVFELVYPISLKIAIEQGYLASLLAFPSQNFETKAQFALMKEKMNEYLMRRCGKTI